MRTTDGHAADILRTEGDSDVAETLAAALHTGEREERYTHGFHTWPAGLHPDAAAVIIEAFGEGAVHDPFCGGGTTLVEAMVAGRPAWGSDLSEIAVLVARARTCLIDEEALTAVRSAARRITETARHATQPPPKEILAVVEPWYAPHVLAELAAVRRGIAATDLDRASRDLLWAAWSSTLVKVSWRASDTSARLEPHDRPPGTAAILFHKKVRELGRRLAALREAVPEGTPMPRIRLGDARELGPPEPVDLVVTSPPYPSVYDYLPMQTLREAWLGVRSEVDGEIGARRAWRQGAKEAERLWRRDTDAWMARAAEALVPGGHMVVVVGDGLTPDGVVQTRGPTWEAGRKAGLVPVASASTGRPDVARDTQRWEHAIALRRDAV